MAYNFVLRKTYSFSVYPSALFGTDWGQCKVLALLDPDSAQRQGFDIYAKHAQVKPSIPGSVNMPDNPEQYDYIQFITPSGARPILGIPWIDESTIQLVGSQVMDVVISGVTVADIPLVIQALAMNKYQQVTATIRPGT